MTRRNAHNALSLLAVLAIFAGIVAGAAITPEKPQSTARDIVCRIMSGGATVTEYIEPGETIRFAPGLSRHDGFTLPALYEIAEPGTSRHYLGQWSLVECRSLP